MKSTDESGPAAQVEVFPSRERAISFATRGAPVAAQDFTSRIPHEYRRLDALARLLRYTTTRCAAVAVNPDGRLVIAVNQMKTPEQKDQILTQIRSLLDTLNKIAHRVPLEDHNLNSLYILHNKTKNFDYLLRIVDGRPKPRDFDLLKEQYRQIHTNKGKTPEEKEFAREQIGRIDAGRIEDLIALELSNPNSRYQGFLNDDKIYQLATRSEVDLQKLTEEYTKGATGVFAIVPADNPFILLSTDLELCGDGVVAMAPDMPELTQHQVVHAEMQIEEYFRSTPGLTPPNYVGISLSCCRLCSACMNVLHAGVLAYRAESEVPYPNVTVGLTVLEIVNRARVNISQLIVGRERLAESEIDVRRSREDRTAQAAQVGGDKEHTQSASIPGSIARDSVERTLFSRHLARAKDRRRARGAGRASPSPRSPLGQRGFFSRAGAAASAAADAHRSSSSDRSSKRRRQGEKDSGRSI